MAAPVNRIKRYKDNRSKPPKLKVIKKVENWISQITKKRRKSYKVNK